MGEEQESFDQLFCRSGKHSWAPGKFCKQCHNEARQRRRKAAKKTSHAKHAASFVDYSRRWQAPDFFPIPAILPILDKYLEIEDNSQEELARRMGVPSRSIARWREPDAKYVSLGMVDRMLCAMDDLQHFYTTLSEFYFAGLEDQVAA